MQRAKCKVKNLFCRMRNWLIEKLGGFTSQEVADVSDEWSRRMDEATDRIMFLEATNSRQLQKIRQLEFDLHCQNEPAEYIAIQKKQVRFYAAESTIDLQMLHRDPRTQEQVKLINLEKKALAGRLGGELLSAGAVTVKEKKDTRRNAYVIRMEVDVLR